MKRRLSRDVRFVRPPGGRIGQDGGNVSGGAVGERVGGPVRPLGPQKSGYYDGVVSSPRH